jgi:hypothetical protein
VSLCSIRLFALILLPMFSMGQKRHILTPDAVLVQHAGSIGYFSGGIGYELFKEKSGNLDLLYGYVPENKGGKLDVLAVKFAYRPLSLVINDLAIFYPVNPGVFFSYTFGENLSFLFDKDQYSRGYYKWSEALRSHISLSNELELNGMKVFGDKSVRAVVLYSEFNTNDLYLVSWATNTDGLSFFEIFKLGVGVRIKF